MPTSSFTKEFSITKMETIEKLEKGIKNIKPIKVNSKKVVSEMKKNEEILLRLLRSNA